MTSGNGIRMPDHQYRPARGLELVHERCRLIGRNGRDRQLLRLCRRRRRLLRPFELRREYRGQLHVLQHRGQSGGPRPAGGRQHGIRGHPPGAAVGALGMTDQEDGGLRPGRGWNRRQNQSGKDGLLQHFVVASQLSITGRGSVGALRTAIWYSTAPAAHAAATVASWVDVAPARIVTRYQDRRDRNHRPEWNDEGCRLHRRCEAGIAEAEGGGAGGEIDEKPRDRARSSHQGERSGYSKNERDNGRDQNGVRGCPEPRVHASEERWQVTLFGKRIQVARSGKRLAHVVAAGRADGANSDEGGTRAAEEQLRGVRERRFRGREIGQRAERNELNQREHDGGDHDRHDEGERHTPAWVAGLTGRDRHDLISAEGKDQQETRSSRTRAGTACGSPESRDRSTAKRPATMKITSGVSFAIVRAFSTRLLCRIPRTLIAVIAAVITAIVAARGPLRDIAGQ